MSSLDDKWQAIITAAVMAWLGWLSLMVVGMRSQMDVQSMARENVIPPVVESSLRELREKGNTDRELILKLTEIATSNAKDISYLRENQVKKP